MKRVPPALPALLALLVLSATSTLAQVVPAGNPIVYGHHHVAASDVAAQVKFFTTAFAGTAMK
jgi:hypothetical protein